MAHVIVAEGLVNREFIDARTTGYDEFVRSLETFTPEYAEADLRRGPRPDRRGGAHVRHGAQRRHLLGHGHLAALSNGTASALGLIHLALLTGHIGRLGTGLNPLRGQNNVQGASDAGAMPFHYPGYMPVDKRGERAQVGARLACRAGRAEPPTRG
jgi:predicted molibdopterin-dependent oxidoreductase YjgC